MASIIQNQPTPLQLAIGVLIGDHKQIIQELFKYRVTCLYDEVRRFSRSAAVLAAKDDVWSGLIDASVGGLVQVIIDNFDAVVHSQDWKMKCHTLTSIVTQPRIVKDEHDITIPRAL